MAEQDADNSYDGAIGWMIMIIIIAIVLWIVWHFNSELISSTIRWIRYGEMWLVSWFIPDDHTILFGGTEYSWQGGFESTPEITGKRLEQLLPFFATLAIEPLRPVFTALMGIIGLWAIFLGPGTQYRKKMGLEDLIPRQAANFPVIAPFVNYNPAEQEPRPPGSDVPAELLPFAEALGPEEWIAYNQIPVPDGVLDKKTTQKALLKQLGRRWGGIKSLENYEKVLLAVFCLRASRKRDDSDLLLGRLALCWSHDKGLKLNSKLLKESLKILRDRELAQKTIEQCGKHAFTTPALLGALQFARSEGGILAPAQFVWLRAHDRNLWYPLNNLGRHSLHAEAMGAHAHYKAERTTGRPIPTPKISDAIDTISEYMESEKARPIPSLDYSVSKKRGIKKAI